jgi:hypothetical protein
LISDDIINDISNKYYFLHLLKDDVSQVKYSINYDENFIDLKNQTKNIIYNLSEQSKIRNIYNFILKRLTYSSVVNFNNYKIFS